MRQLVVELTRWCEGAHWNLLKSSSKAMAVQALIDTFRVVGKASGADPQRLAALLRHEAGGLRERAALDHDGEEFYDRLCLAVCGHVTSVATRGSLLRTAVESSVDNRLDAAVSGPVVQAGAVHGNVTINHWSGNPPPPVEASDAGMRGVGEPGMLKTASPSKRTGAAQFGDPWWICTGAAASLLSAAVLWLLGGLLGQATATGVVTGLLAYLAASTTALVADRRPLR